MSVCVIYNPTTGRGRAARRLRSLLESKRDSVVEWPTRFAGQARELAARAVSEGPPDHPEVFVGRGRTALLRSEASLAVRSDGEIYLRPEDGVRELSVELLPKRLRVKVCDPAAEAR